MARTRPVEEAHEGVPTTWHLPDAPYARGTVYDVEVNDDSCAKTDGDLKKLVTHKVSTGSRQGKRGRPRTTGFTQSPEH